MYVNREDLFGGPTQALDLVGMLYDTVGNPGLWPAALAAVAQALHAQGGGMIFRDELSPSGTVNVGYQLQDAMMESYGAYYGAMDLYVAASLRALPGTVTLGTDLIPDSVLKKTEFYSDFLKPAHVEHQCGILLEREGPRFAALTLTAGGDQEAFGRLALERLHVLTPHLRRVLRLNSAVSRTQTKAAGLLQALNAMDRIVFGVAADGSVVFTSSRAETYLLADQAVTCTGGRLHMKGIRQDRDFQALLAATSTRSIDASYVPGIATMVAQASASDRVMVMPYLGEVTGPHDKPLAALVFIHTRSEAPATRSNVMRALYRLTPTELRIVHLLAAGHDVSGIAQALGTNANLVRFHLKNVYRKMNVKKQSDVIRVIFSLPADAG